MARWVGVLGLLLAAAGSTGAGELVFRSGSRIAGELSNETLMISTGGAVIEIVPEQVAVLTADEIRLRDGRVLRGTLVGGRFKARTDLGELGIKVDDLEVFRAGDVVAGAATPPAASAIAPPAVPDPPGGPGQVHRGAEQVGRGVAETTKGVGRTITDGVDRVHDGAKRLGLTIWDAMRSVGRAFQSVFSGS